MYILVYYSQLFFHKLIVKSYLDQDWYFRVPSNLKRFTEEWKVNLDQGVSYVR